MQRGISPQGSKYTYNSVTHAHFAQQILHRCLQIVFQDVTLQHYMDYTAESLIPVMAHIAKNVVKVNNGLTKHMVSFLYFKF